MTTAILQPDHDALLNRGFAALPAAYRIPAVAATIDEARALCKQLVLSRHKNFRTAAWSLPNALRVHVYAIIAFSCIPDQVGDRPATRALLDLWGRELDACYDGRARHPVFVALAEAIRDCSIPKEPFADLLTALSQDQAATRYRTMGDLLEYCRSSVNPVGRMVLYACGYSDVERLRLSDAISTAMRLANFWQNVRADFAKGRVYLPQEDMQRFGVTDEAIAGGIATPAVRALLDYEVDFTHRLFEEGLPLIGMVSRDLAVGLDLFSRAGFETLRAIERCDYDVLTTMPSLSKRTKLALAFHAIGSKYLPFLRLGPRAIGKAA